MVSRLCCCESAQEIVRYRCKHADTTRSMLEKGCSPGNAAYEGFFGRLKNELFHSKNWEDVTFDGLSRLPDERIEKSLGHMSPNNTVEPTPSDLGVSEAIVHAPWRMDELRNQLATTMPDSMRGNEGFRPLGVSFALGCDSTEGLLCYESR